MNLAAVRNLMVTQSVLQRILRSGNISLDTGYQGVVTIPDVPEAVRFRDFVLDAIDALPEGGESETDEISDYTDKALPWDLREGGRDER